MKLKAYDKYHKQHIIIESDDDTIYEHASSPRGIHASVYMIFSATEGDRDGCNPERWSDLEDIEVIE